MECPQCQGAFQKNHLKEHMTQECPRRQVCCPNCATSMAYEDKEVLSLPASTCIGLLLNVTSIKKKKWSRRALLVAQVRSYKLQGISLGQAKAGQRLCLDTPFLETLWYKKTCVTTIDFWLYHQKGVASTGKVTYKATSDIYSFHSWQKGCQVVHLMGNTC